MSRMWEIREGYDPHEISYRHGKSKMMGMGDEYEEAYCEGYEDGFGEAMEKVAEKKYGHMGYRDEMRYSRGGSHYGNRMGYRDEDDDDDKMGERMGYRRRRDSRGRYM